MVKLFRFWKSSSSSQATEKTRWQLRWWRCFNRCSCQHGDWLIDACSTLGYRYIDHPRNVDTSTWSFIGRNQEVETYFILIFAVDRIWWEEVTLISFGWGSSTHPSIPSSYCNRKQALVNTNPIHIIFHHQNKFPASTQTLTSINKPVLVAVLEV